MMDLLVIGAGLSGLVAAYTAAKAGLKVKVIAKGLGALHWGAGTVDVLGYTADDPIFAVQRPLERLDALPENHPYRLLGRERIEAALASFQALSRELNLPYAGAETAGDNLLLPSPAGAVRPTFLAPQAQLAGDLSRPEPLLIVGLQGLRDFYPLLIAENLTRQGYPARAAFLPLSLISERRDSNTVQLAQALDDPTRRQRLAAELKRLVQPGERIGLPAILGLEAHPATLAELEAETGAAVFEIPTLPPSVPGMRLFKALRSKLQALGVRVEVGMEVTGFGLNRKSEIRNPKSIAWVESETSARPLKHRARSFLLATGGVLGGGFNSDHTGRVWEVIFDLPLTVPQRRSQWFRAAFLDPAGHPVFQGGVAVNEHLQPVGGDGRPIFANLWAAGGVLAHADPIRERSLEGIAIATGIAAAREMIDKTQQV